MRDPERITETIAALERAWRAHPSLRLGQLVVNAARTNDPYYVEDDRMLDGLRRWASSPIGAQRSGT